MLKRPKQAVKWINIICLSVYFDLVFNDIVTLIIYLIKDEIPI
jgi:hypothetical protein